MALGLTLVLIAIVLAAAVTDLRWSKIPNILTFPSMGIGLIGHTWLSGMEGLWFSAGGLAVGFFVLIGFYALGGMAAGDVKLLAAVGAFLGPNNVFLVFLMTAILGGVYSIGMMTHEMGFRGMMQHVFLIFKTLLLTGKVKLAFTTNDPNQKKLRYGLVIALGTLTYEFWFWVGIG